MIDLPPRAFRTHPRGDDVPVVHSTSRRLMRIPSARTAAVLTALAVASACTDRAPSPTGLSVSASRSGVPFTSGLASPAWQGRAATLVAQAGFNPQTATHGYPLLGVAQFVADRGAVAGASAVVLTYLFPSQAQALEDLVTTQANAGPGGPHPAFSLGEAIGRAVGAAIVVRAQGDGFSAPFTGTIPVGPGFWISNTTPSTIAGGQLPGVTPWF